MSASSGSAASGFPQQLNGVTLVATGVTGGHAIVPGSTISLTFENGSLSARAGCNNMFGPYTVTGDTLTAPQLASTMMACDEALMKQDTWLSAFLASSPTWTYAAGTLTLTSGTDTIALAQAPSGAAVLEGTGWKLGGLLSASGSTVSAVPAGLTAWVRFADGRVVLNTSCNSGSGKVEIGDTTMTFGPIATTRMACSSASSGLEQSVLAVLQGTTHYRVKDDPAGALLTIMSEDGKTGLQFVADPAVGADAMGSAEATPSVATPSVATSSSARSSG